MKALRVFVTLSLLCAASAAHAFNYAQYQEESLDTLLTLSKPESKSVRLVAPQKLRIKASLSEYAKSCNTGFLKRAMIMHGISPEIVERIPLSKCIKVKSEKGRITSVYIQDQVAGYLPKEVKLGEEINFFCDFLFYTETGLGLLVNEYQ